MKSGFRHAVVVAAILVFSIIFGLICDLVLTGAEKKKYPLPYREEIVSNAEECGIPPALLAALIHVRSGFDASLSGTDGGIGLFRITPETYERICEILPEGATADPAVLYDPSVNLYSGAGWLRYLYMRYGDLDTALVAFLVGTDKTDEWCRDASVADKDGRIVNLPDRDAEASLAKIKKTRARYEKLWGL